ncbi:MAG: 16S rRNA (guanine(966)-N(2))-methyltransferase RsmD [bacterium]
MIRIISGECKGRRLKTLKGRAVRPTSDRAKQTLFDILQDRINGCNFLDLFSGSGGIGFEAASRGAGEVYLIESDPNAMKIIKENAVLCGFGKNVSVYEMDCGQSLRRISKEKKTFDLIFLDPPYTDHAAYELIEIVGEEGLLSKGGLVIAEHDRRHALPKSFGVLRMLRTRRVGDTVFSFYGGDVEK